ncbi:hypothetical protein ABD86_27720 [Paenibacillus alvei]|nr:hypothetical protein [Paenibacillus alvei]MBG9747508.1 hypothetical protein [Paenibacillus alvei]
MLYKQAFHNHKRLYTTAMQFDANAQHECISRIQSHEEVQLRYMQVLIDNRYPQGSITLGNCNLSRNFVTHGGEWNRFTLAHLVQR